MTVTRTQAQTRFKTLTPLLQSAMFSIQTSESIARIAEQNSLAGDKSTQVGEIAGLVMMGFMRLDEVAAEIEARLGVSTQAARTIADSLNSKIFSSLKVEIDRAYEPLPGTAPKPAAPSSSQAFRPSGIVDEIKQLEKSGEELVDVLKKMEAPTRPTQTPMPAPIAKPAPQAPARMVAPEPFKPAAPAPAVRPTPSPSPAPTMTGPVILHQESETSPLASGSDFRLDIPVKKFSQQTTSPTPPPQGAAKLEIGGQARPQGGVVAKTNVIQPEKFMNYGPSANSNAAKTPGSFVSSASPAPTRSVNYSEAPTRPQTPQPPRVPAQDISSAKQMPTTPRPSSPSLPPLPDKNYQPAVPEKKSSFGWLSSLFGKRGSADQQAPKVVNISSEKLPEPPKAPIPPPSSQAPRPNNVVPPPVPPRPTSSQLPPTPTVPRPSIDIKPKLPGSNPGQSSGEEVIDLSSLTKIKR